MKILLSAYACEPNRGSEPGVGWNWALELARMGHEVWVLTRSNNFPVIEPVVRNLPEKDKLHFLYYDLPRWACWWKKGGRGVHLYYCLWQWGAYRFARGVHAKVHFDLAHHVTFVSVRQPSLMGNLGIPFVFGPVAGGEKAPWRLRIGCGARGWFLDAVRDLANLLVKVDPFMWHTFRKADKIYVTSEQTKRLLPRSFQRKAHVQLAIGWQGKVKRRFRKPEDSPFRAIFIGRFVYWKGMHLGLNAFAKLVEVFPSARLTLVGQGSDENRWRRLAEQRGILGNIDWISWVKQEELSDIYLQHDVLLFPSLHDSGGMVVLEAMAHGLPVICLDLGGPGVMVDATCGQVIATSKKTQSEVLDDLAEALANFAKNKLLLEEYGTNALKKALSFQWDLMVGELYANITR